LTPSSPLYAIGDIHGQFEMLKAAHARIRRDQLAENNATAPVVHVGDLVDRGPDSRSVIDYMIRGRERGENWVTIKGNHDRLFTMFLEDPRAADPVLRADYTWLHPNMGGRETLASYGVNADAGRHLSAIHAEAVEKVPGAHREYLRALPLFHAAGDCLFVHAGIRPGVAPAAQREDDLVWIRGDFHRDTRDHGALIVHGHTSIKRATHYGNRVNIDSGAAWGGPLSAVVIQDRDVWLLTDQGRRSLALAG